MTQEDYKKFDRIMRIDRKKTGLKTKYIHAAINIKSHGFVLYKMMPHDLISRLAKENVLTDFAGLNFIKNNFKKERYEAPSFNIPHYGTRLTKDNQDLPF